MNYRIRDLLKEGDLISLYSIIWQHTHNTSHKTRIMEIQTNTEVTVIIHREIERLNPSYLLNITNGQT
jgi:hypothetical protein